MTKHCCVILLQYPNTAVIWTMSLPQHKYYY